MEAHVIVLEAPMPVLEEVLARRLDEVVAAASVAGLPS